MLTAKQRELLVFLGDYLEEHEVSPSFDEMRKAVGLASKSGIHRLVIALEERGYIRRLANRARAIEILRRAGHKEAANTDEAASDVASGDANGGASGGASGDAGHSDEATIQLPLLGRIAAGTPIEALSDTSTLMSVPADMIGQGEHFALEIVGDSMVEAGIHDGDTVIIQRTEQAISGDIVVALIDQQEATLKTLRKEQGRVGLVPANQNYETRYFSSDKVRIQGKLKGLIRRYR